MGVALVTGAGARIGRAVALALGADGYTVLVHYNRSAAGAQETVDTIIAAGGRAEAVQADLADMTQVQALADHARFAGVSLLVNSASWFEFDTAETLDPETALYAYRANTLAPILLARAVRQACGDGVAGLVVNILDNKLNALNPDHFSYTLAKSALHASTTMLALEFAPVVRVCGIAPGITLPNATQSQARFELAHRTNPLGRGCTPGQIVATVRYFRDAPGITGQVVTIDGGQSLTGMPRDIDFLIDEGSSTA